MALLFFSFLCLLCSHAAPVSPSPGWSGATAADVPTLLSFKSVLSAGPSDSEVLLASWNTSSHHGSWPGVVCGRRRHRERVAALLLGSGSFGIVYEGELDGQAGESTNLVAVKVLKHQTRKALKSFTAECKALQNIRHRSLVKIITICSSIDTRGNGGKAIVYDFMLNGNLEGWLHPDTHDQAEQKHLNLHQRVTILLDVACALDYLHCHGPAPVVHCDLKSGNVLLDAKMVAHVGDFGLARILAEGSSSFLRSTSSMGFRGTIGYAAPEYGAGNMASTNGDIYSYGILVLETVTGKRPTDSRFIQGLSLRECVEQALHHHAMMGVVDARLCLNLENELQTMDASSSKRKIDCLISLLRLECLALRKCHRAECQPGISSRNCMPSKDPFGRNAEYGDGRNSTFMLENLSCVDDLFLDILELPVSLFGDDAWTAIFHSLHQL